MPLGEYTVSLKVTGSFRDARHAATTIKRLAENAVEREVRQDKHHQQSFGGNWSPSEHPVRKIEVTQ